MKTLNISVKRVLYLSTFLFILMLVIGCKPTPGEEGKIEFKAEFKEKVPEALNIYIHKPQKWSDDSLYEKFRKMNIDDKGKMEKNEMGYVYNAGSHFILISPETGAEMYADSARFMVEEPGKYPKMDEKSVMKLADRYIQETLKINPENTRYLKTQYLHNAIQKLGGEPEVTVDESIALYARNINGIKIIGDGGFIRLHLDNTGYVTGYQKSWRNWQLHKKDYKIKPYEKAKEEYMKIMQSRLKKGNLARVTNIRFGYYERGLLEEQKYLQPAYVFTTKFYDRESKQSTAAVMEVIPAIDNLFEPIVVDEDLSKEDDKRPEKQ